MQQETDLRPCSRKCSLALLPVLQRMACPHARTGPLYPQKRATQRRLSQQQRSKYTVARTSRTETSSPSSIIPAPSGEPTTEPVCSDTSFRKTGRAAGRPIGDLVAGPVLRDSDYGEHAAAFLSGNFQPIIYETSAVIEISHGERGQSSSLKSDRQPLNFIGNLPVDFPGGKFIYVGPNPKFSREQYKAWGKGPGQAQAKEHTSSGWHHWFEGDGMIYAVDFGRRNDEREIGNYGRFDLQDNESVSKSGPASRKLTFRNRYVRTKSWHDELRRGMRLFRPLMNASGMAFLPNAIANLIFGGNFLKDSANTALCFFADRLFALQDTMPPWELNQITLETKGPCDFDGSLPFFVPFTAHPKVAPGTGHLLFFGFNPVYPPHCTIGSVSPDGVVGPLKPLWHNAAHGATFMHDFCLTEHYTILFEGSMNIRPLRMLKGVHPLQYDRSQLARFGLIRRDKSANMSEVVWCKCTEAEMVYHFVNAWEDSHTGEIVVIGVREDGFFHGALAATGTREWITKTLEQGTSVPRMHEWRIDPSRGEVVSERWLFDDIVEVPRINDSFTGVQNQYAYAGRIHTASLSQEAQLKFDAVVKYDINTGMKQVYEHGSGRYGMEAQFVPRSSSILDKDESPQHGESSSEDDGWLVLFVHDEGDANMSAAEGCSECIILDAKRIQEGPIARIMLPTRVPYGAHAMWCPLADDSDHHPASSKHESMLSRIPPEPRAFAISEGQQRALLGAVMTGVLRAASGLFVNGWRPCIAIDDREQYAFIRMFGFRLDELNSLGMFRKKQIETENKSGHIFGDIFALPAGISIESALPSLTLFELEGCGDCRLVRETLSMLDIACTHRPCPHGAVRNRLAAAAAQTQTFGERRDEYIYPEDAKLPYLEDERTGVRIAGADQIIEYLYSEYLDGAPPPMLSSGKLAAMFAQIAVDARGSAKGSDEMSPFRRGPSGAFYSRPARTPEKPLQLWAYEASPFCALVRETLSELELSYVLQPCARGSPRRTHLMNRTGGTFQVPFLEDPNTGVAIFESSAIINYLRSRYLQL